MTYDHKLVHINKILYLVKLIKMDGREELYSVVTLSEILILSLKIHCGNLHLILSFLPW